MKTRKLFNLFVILSIICFLGINIQAQTITIGTGANSNNYNSWPAPYGNYEYGARYQIIIKASELITEGAVAGDITSIAFDVSSVNNCSSLSNFSIKIGNSPQSDFETSSSWISGLTTVYSSTYQPITGWNTHVFDNSFYWDGISDIVIETCFYNGSYSENASMKNSTTSQKMVIGSEGSFDPCNNTTTPYTYNVRPNIKLDMQTSSVINENDLVKGLTIYPNPTHNKLTIQLNNNRINEVSLIDMQGKIIYKKFDNKNKVNIDLSSYNKGIYFIHIISNKQSINKKITVY